MSPFLVSICGDTGQQRAGARIKVRVFLGSVSAWPGGSSLGGVKITLSFEFSPELLSANKAWL